MAITRIGNPALANVREPNFRNIIINGDMSQSQRSTSVTGITGAGYKTLDRFRLGGAVPGTWTWSQSTDVPTGQGFAKSMKLDCTTTGSADTMYFQHKMEGQNLQYLKKGTSSAESTTLSFWVKSNKTGTYIAMLLDNDNTRHISKSYTISSANTWEKKTITYAGDTSGAFGNDNGASLEVYFWLSANSNNSSGTLATSWASVTNANNAVGQVNLADSTSNDFYITGVQLEAGTASDFEFLPVDVNLQRCQRYYENLITKENQSMLCSGYNQDSGQVQGILRFRVDKRATPTMGYEVGIAYQATSQTARTDTTPLFYQASSKSVLVYATSNVSVTAGQGVNLVNRDNGTGMVFANSEL